MSIAQILQKHIVYYELWMLDCIECRWVDGRILPQYRHNTYLVRQFARVCDFMCVNCSNGKTKKKHVLYYQFGYVSRLL